METQDEKDKREKERQARLNSVLNPPASPQKNEFESSKLPVSEANLTQEQKDESKRLIDQRTKADQFVHTHPVTLCLNYPNHGKVIPAKTNKVEIDFTKNIIRIDDGEMELTGTCGITWSTELGSEPAIPKTADIPPAKTIDK